MFFNGDKIILGVHDYDPIRGDVDYYETKATVKRMDGSLYTGCDDTFEDFYIVKPVWGKSVTCSERNMKMYKPVQRIV